MRYEWDMSETCVRHTWDIKGSSRRCWGDVRLPQPTLNQHGHIYLQLLVYSWGWLYHTVPCHCVWIEDPRWGHSSCQMRFFSLSNYRLHFILLFWYCYFRCLGLCNDVYVVIPNPIHFPFLGEIVIGVSRERTTPIFYSEPYYFCADSSFSYCLV